MKLISRVAAITSFSTIQPGRVSRRVESIGEPTIPTHSQQNLQSRDSSGNWGIEKHLAQIGKISYYMRSLLILIFSAVLTYGIPIHAQETIEIPHTPGPESWLIKPCSSTYCDSTYSCRAGSGTPTPPSRADPPGPADELSRRVAVIRCCRRHPRKINRLWACG